MKAFVTAQVRPFLIISSVLAVWMLLAAEPVQAHTTNLPAPRCSGLPADTFLADVITPITAGGVATSPSPSTKQGTDLTNEGDRDFYYAKITVPALTAGELRVFDTGGDPATEDGPSDAVLCHGSSQREISRTTYTYHDQASRVKAAADAATAARTAATAPAPADVDTESKARTAYNNARSALNAAASELTRAATALRNAANAAQTQAEKTLAGNAAREAELAAQTATDQYHGRGTYTDYVYRTPTYPDGSDSAAQAELRRGAYNDARTEIQGAAGLQAAATALAGTANADPLAGAAGALEKIANDDHVGFQIRADVQLDDRSYVLVVSANDAPTLAVAFHGAISSDGSLSGAFDAGKSSETSILVTAPGLLTLETTGTTDTAGVLDNGATPSVEIAQADSGGSSGNFKMYAPVTAATDAYTLYVSGQTDTTSGSYDLKMDFQVAMGQIAALSDGEGTIAEGPAWGATALPDDTLGSPAIQDSSDTDYFVFTIADNHPGLLTVHAEDGTTSPASDTTGTLYGPPGVEIASATDGSGKHFRVRAPVQELKIYAVEVSGTVGSYTPKVRLDAVEAMGGSTDRTLLPVTGSTTEGADGNCATETDNDEFEICPPTGRNPAEREQHLLEVTEAGALYIHSTGGTDTIGTLFGPDGSQLVTDDDSGPGSNFRLALNVTPGLYLLEVRGKDANTRGAYELVTNFVTGAEVEDPTDTGTGDDDDDDDTDTGTGTGTGTPGAVDPTGTLEEPAHGSFRSGIGVLRGWVCSTGGTGVEIRLTNTSTNQTTTVIAPNGSDRGDVDTRQLCDGRVSPDTVGFAVQFNYNLLPAGEYEAEAWVGGIGRNAQQVGRTSDGQTNTFEVVRISDDEFLTDAELEQRGLGPDEVIECEVPNFPPDTRQTVILGWDEASQNFQIVDVE